MAVVHEFTKEDMEVDHSLGFPKAYPKLCKHPSLNPYIHHTLYPYTLNSQQALKAKELDELFPVSNPKAKPTGKPRMYVSLLWKQLNHLGNAGFDPAKFRVDPYGNVLYFHADSASPLAWDIDHWFPCSRGGLTIPSNLRILQWQVCKRKHNQLEFLVPWWDLQLGISINQFLSIFAASNSDFRHRAFRWLFSGGENEELNEFQTVEHHNFPQPFMESKDQSGLAPAALVQARRESRDPSPSMLESLDMNRQTRPTTPFIAAAATKLRNDGMKENEMPTTITNPYQAIVMARDSLKQREEANKMKAEIQRLDAEVDKLKQKNEEDKTEIQELELALIKQRRRAEKCRRLAEAQSSYRTMLEKMIRNSMHQSVIYKEQVRLNKAAASALVARLEAQKVICNSAEEELHKRLNQKDDLEKQVLLKFEPRKRSRMDENDEGDGHGAPSEDDGKALISLTKETKTEARLRKELRVFLEEEQKLSEAALSLIEERKEEEEEELKEPLKLSFGQENCEGSEIQEDEESRKERGKGNVEKWLQILLEDTVEENQLTKTDIENYPEKEIQVPGSKEKVGGGTVKVSEEVEKSEGSNKKRSVSTLRKSMSSRKGEESSSKQKWRSESARSFRQIPSSPSIILNMRKGVDCITK